MSFRPSQKRVWLNTHKRGGYKNFRGVLLEMYTWRRRGGVNFPWPLPGRGQKQGEMRTKGTKRNIPREASLSSIIENRERALIHSSN